MAKKFKHNVCGRSFRTRNGLRTHVICEPVAPATQPAPTQEKVSTKQHDCLVVHPEHAYVDKNGTPRTGHVRWVMGAAPKVSVA